MSHPLNRAVWSALSSRQAPVSLGGGHARRFIPEISPFAAARDNSVEALTELAGLMTPEEAPVYLLQAEEIALPPSLEAEKTALGVLMTERRPQPPRRGAFSIEPLGKSDIPAMSALAELTKPGPFTKRTPELGQFWGIKREGQLAAMGGTRLDLEGYTEVSGVCTHPAFQGHGLGSTLALHIAASIRARGDLPFLHAYADNEGAIALYRKLGFEIWSEVHIAVLRKTAATAS